MPELDIAVPMYNAAHWTDDLFESILAQTPSFDWRIIARDDASTDDTVARLVAWQRRLRERLTVLPSGPNLGPVGNYDAVLAATTAPWVMLADPDDVWKPAKMMVSVTAMSAAERQWSVSRPIAIFTDAEVTDSLLHPITDSYWHWMRQNPDLCGTFRRVLVDSPAISSTMIVNRALLDLALPMTGAAACQDWWLALVACCFGSLIALRERTILYRRHSANDSVAPTTVSLANAVSQVGNASARIEWLVSRYSEQAGGFLRRFDGRIPSEYLPALQSAANLPSANALARRWQVLRHGLWFGSTVKNAGLMLFL
jgi:hypothetical protein